MIPENVREDISRYLGCEPRNYAIPSLSEDMQTSCECWDLPPVKEGDKPVHLRYREITARILRMMEEDKGDPRIAPLVEQANELIEGVPVTRKYGTPVISMPELLKLDKWKGIRKEWWELRGRFVKDGVRVFLGYGQAQAGMPREADLLVAMPGEDQYEYLRIHGTRGNNRPLDTAVVIAALRRLDKAYGVEIVSAAEDSVEFVFRRMVEAESVKRVRQRLSRLCPSAEALTEGIRLGRVALWWD